MEYIFKTLADSDYYFNINKYINELTEILNYYKDFKFISKYEDIILLQDIIQKKRIGFEKFLSDYQLAQKINLRAPIIKYLYSKYPENAKNENIINEHIRSWDTYEDMIKKNVFKKKMRKDVKQLLVKYFAEKKNQNLLLKIFKQEEIDYFINGNTNKNYNTTRINTSIICIVEGNDDYSINKEKVKINNKNSTFIFDQHETHS